MYGLESAHQYGLESAHQRSIVYAYVISAVEPVGADVQITVGGVMVNGSGRVNENATVRLTPTDLDGLIDVLVFARTQVSERAA